MDLSADALEKKPIALLNCPVALARDPIATSPIDPATAPYPSPSEKAPSERAEVPRAVELPPDATALAPTAVAFVPEATAVEPSAVEEVPEASAMAPTAVASRLDAFAPAPAAVEFTPVALALVAVLLRVEGLDCPFCAWIAFAELITAAEATPESPPSTKVAAITLDTRRTPDDFLPFARLVSAAAMKVRVFSHQMLLYDLFTEISWFGRLSTPINSPGNLGKTLPNRRDLIVKMNAFAENQNHLKWIEAICRTVSRTRNFLLFGERVADAYICQPGSWKT